MKLNVSSTSATALPPVHRLALEDYFNIFQYVSNSTSCQGTKEGILCYLSQRAPSDSCTCLKTVLKVS